MSRDALNDLTPPARPRPAERSDRPDPAGEKPVVEVRDLWFRYDRRPVLEAVQVTVPRGSFFGLVGPNGGGKTTLLKLILGSVRPTRGTVSVFQRPALERRHRARIGYVPQHAAHVDPLFPATLEELVATGASTRRGLWPWGGREERAAVREALERTGLWSLRRRLVGELSGGQQQRAFIARALAGRPELLLLDEPTAGIDADAQDRFYQLLRRLHRDGITLVLISHDMAVVTREVTDLACLNRRLVYHGDPQGFDWRQEIETLYGEGMRHVSHRHS